MIKTDYICAIAKELNDINTGDWKTCPVIIDQEKCIQCGICVMYCPTNSVKKRDEQFIIEPAYCKGCGVCVHECRQKAIYFEREVK